MIVFPLLAAGPVIKVVAALFVLCALSLVLVVLVQKGKGGGLSSAFGGGAGGGLLGSKTGDFLTWFTIAMAGLFLFFAILLAMYLKPTVSEVEVQQRVPASTGSEVLPEANSMDSPE